jgi:hypothetical protein
MKQQLRRLYLDASFGCDDAGFNLSSEPDWRGELACFRSHKAFSPILTRKRFGAKRHKTTMPASAVMIATFTI